MNGILLPPNIDYDQEFGAATRTKLRPFLNASRSRRVRPIEQWAEDEIVIPTGPFEGLRFSMDRQPVAKLLYASFSDPHWQEYAITGSTQTGKSFLGFALPVCWTLCERMEDVIISAPTKEILEDKVKRDIYPILEASRYKDIIPKRGGGSKGGIPDRIDMTNGTVLKLMSFEGGDKSKASFTCANIFMTEVDGSRSQTTSLEANPIEQIKARARATEREKRFILYECTVSEEDNHIWRLVHDVGSAAQIMLRCEYCGCWCRPDREHFKGWEQATSEIEAEEKAAWHCVECDHPWTEADRKKANLNAKLIHKGQTIDKGGVIHGDYPPTRTLGFRFSAVNNLFLPACDIGVDCWNNMQDEDDLDGEKKLTQFVFCLPYRPPGLDVVKMKREEVEQRQLQYPQGSVPQSSNWITIGVDVGKWNCWWVAISWLLPERIGLIMDYGKLRMRVKHGDKWGDANNYGFDLIFNTVMDSWLKGINKGWMGHNGEIKFADAIWIDSRYQGEDPDLEVVYDWIRGAGDRAIIPIMGHSKNQYKRANYPKANVGARRMTKIGHEYHIKYIPEIKYHRGHINSDHWKTIVQRGFLKDPGAPGSLMLYESKNPREHATFVKHIDSEVMERRFEPAKGHVEEWVVKREANHFLDATVYACAAGHAVGFRADESHERKARKTRRNRGLIDTGGRAYVASQR